MTKLHLDATSMTINSSSFTEPFSQCFCIFCLSLENVFYSLQVNMHIAAFPGFQIGIGLGSEKAFRSCL